MSGSFSPAMLDLLVLAARSVFSAGPVCHDPSRTLGSSRRLQPGGGCPWRPGARAEALLTLLVHSTAPQTRNVQPRVSAA